MTNGSGVISDFFARLWERTKEGAARIRTWARTHVRREITTGMCDIIDAGMIGACGWVAFNVPILSPLAFWVARSALYARVRDQIAGAVADFIFKLPGVVWRQSARFCRWVASLWRSPPALPVPA